jgi:glycosyltransferase involved in cell wall biosynthesis
VLTVIRGTYQANLPELEIYANLAKHGFAPELLGARRTAYRDEEVPMPVRRLATPALGGALSRNLVGGYVLGRVNPYRYLGEYLRGFDRAVERSSILAPVDLGHPTSYQAIAHRPRKKVVVQRWDNIPFNWPTDRPLARHYEAVLEGADLFLAFSKMADWALVREGVTADRRLQIYCGLDVLRHRPPRDEEREAARRALKVDPGAVVATFVGRLFHGKGIFTLLEAWPEVDSRVRLRLVGSGPERAKAEIRARQLGVDRRVEFVGPVPHGRLQEWALWASDLFLMPSLSNPQWREQLPQTVVEAMAAGLPVIASSSGSIPETVQDGRTGLLVPPDLPADWAGAINALAADPERRRHLGDAGRRVVEQVHDADRNARTLSDALWRRVLGEEPPGTA